MNISQLEYLVASVDQGSFSDAARTLYVSSQAVSKAISGLEKELHLELFEKSGRGIAPTQHAVLLATRAKEVIYGYQDMKEYAGLLAVENEDEPVVKGSIKVAITASPYEGSLVPYSIFDLFKNRFPGIDLNYIHSPSASCLTAVQEGVMDAAIILGRYFDEKYVCSRIIDIPMHVAISVNHPLAKEKEIAISRARHYPIARPYDLRYCFPLIEKHFRERHYRSRFVEVIPTPKDYSHFLDQEKGLAFVFYGPSLEGLIPGVQFLPLIKDDQVKVPVCFVYPAEGGKSRISSLLQKNLVRSSFNKIKFDAVNNRIKY